MAGRLHVAAPVLLGGAFLSQKKPLKLSSNPASCKKTQEFHLHFSHARCGSGGLSGHPAVNSEVYFFYNFNFKTHMSHG